MHIELPTELWADICELVGYYFLFPLLPSYTDLLFPATVGGFRELEESQCLLSSIE